MRKPAGGIILKYTDTKLTTVTHFDNIANGNI